MIKVHLSRLLGERKLKMADVARDTGISKTTLLALYHERAKGVTFEVLGKICVSLDCQPGDLLENVQAPTLEGD